MRAAVMRNRQIVVDTLPDPAPGPGEVLVRTLACGICGSDLHALKHADQMVEAARESAGDMGDAFGMDPERDLVMGHEFCAEVIDYGPDTQGMAKPGERVVCMPILIRGGKFMGVGYSNDVPGGYGELMVLSAALALPVPNGLGTDHAALTEPMAVGLHAVEKSRIERHETPIVVGCGPVGLAVIAACKLRGLNPIVAADYSPKRRAMATAMGAHVVVDAKETNAVQAWRDTPGGGPPVIFECVGVPGMLRQLMRQAPTGARIVVAGVCMQEDHIRPMVGINKELNLQFVLGYTPGEFAQTLQSIAEGQIAVAPMITGTVGIDGVAQAFEDLGTPETHAKILVEPGRA
jgi:threonine dehydrogenase-like Zn-dependent dehydrogenase